MKIEYYNTYNLSTVYKLKVNLEPRMEVPISKGTRNTIHSIDTETIVSTELQRVLFEKVLKPRNLNDLYEVKRILQVNSNIPDMYYALTLIETFIKVNAFKYKKLDFVEVKPTTEILL